MKRLARGGSVSFGGGGGNARPIHGPRPRCARARLRRSKIVPDNFVERGSLPNPPPAQMKRPARGGPVSFGGGGGNRTPVRRRSAPGATCLAHRSISSRGNTMGKVHRGTSTFWFNRGRRAATAAIP